MRIDKLTTRIVSHVIDSTRLIRSHAGLHDESRFLEVTITDRDGRAGYGEAATTPLWSGESAESAQQLVEQVIAPALAGADVAHPAEFADAMDRLVYGAPFARGAVDCALWDLWGRSQQAPVCELIADRPVVTAVPSRGSIGAYPVDKTAAVAAAFYDVGVRTLKLKIGTGDVDDLARLQAVRERCGADVTLTVDANGAYASADAAVRAIESLAPAGLALVEQPTPRGRLSMMAAVRQRVDIPILADESIFTPADLEEALALDAFDLLSVYAGKNGGFTRSLDMVRRAAELGIPCAIGSNLETHLGQAPMQHLAGSMAAFPVETLACDLLASLYYPTSSVAAPVPFEGGCAILPEGPGFGVTPVTG
jgi:muconate cycloisomerase